MRIKKGFTLRDVCGEHVLFAEGIENIDFSNIISMNKSSAYLWNKIQDCDFDAKTLTKLLLDEYDVDEATAKQDSETLLKQWLEAGIIE